MNITLTRTQITDLFEVLARNEKESTPLYEELKRIIRLSPRANLDRTFDLDLSEEEVRMVRELLTPPEREITPDRIFEEMKRDKKRTF